MVSTCSSRDIGIKIVSEMKVNIFGRRKARSLLLRCTVVIVIATALLYVTCSTYCNRLSVTYKNQTSKEHITNHARISDHDNPSDYIRRIFDSLDQKYIIDLSNAYQFVPNVVAPPRVVYPSNSTQVTLCTQASDNHLNDVKELAGMWKGPISVAVFTTSERLPYLIYTIVRMRKCNAHVRKYVQFHVALPVIHTESTLKLIPAFEFDCTLSDNMVNGTTRNYAIGSTYPSNMLRTIAIKYSDTAYVTSLDIDLVPSKDLNAMLQTFLRDEDLQLSADENKVAYVLPAFEIGLKSFPPLSKHHVILLWSEVIRPFYIDLCIECHAFTDYLTWLDLPKSDRMEASYNVTWNSIWEPFYVARKSGLPLFDTQFKNYGFNRVSQICELYVAGYTFKVLNNGFVVHRGLKHKGSSLSHTSLMENKRNRVLFETVFRAELKSRYPESDRVCLKKSKKRRKSVSKHVQPKKTLTHLQPKLNL